MTLKTIQECAKELNISSGWLRRAIASGKVPSLPLGNRALVYAEDVQKALPKANYVKIAAVMKHTGLTDTAIRRAVADGWMPYEKSGKAFVFDLDAVDAVIKQRMKGQKTQK